MENVLNEMTVFVTNISNHYSSRMPSGNTITVMLERNDILKEFGNYIRVYTNRLLITFDAQR